MSILVLIVGIILFIGLIIVHEFGHFITARRNGVVAEEFGIFFGPKIFQRQMKGNWLFSIRLLPLGGFVKMKGEHDSDTEAGSFGAASVWAKTKIMGAGVFMNLIVGVILLTILAWIGLPQLIPNQFNVQSASHVSNNEVLVTSVEPNSPASSIGLQDRDQIIAIGKIGHPAAITSLSDLQYQTKKFAGQKVEVKYKQNGQLMQREVKLQTLETVAASIKANKPKGYLGISLATLTLRQYNVWAGPVEAIGLTGQVIKLTFIGLGHALAGLGHIIAGFVTGNTKARQHGQAVASSQVAGPVGIFVILRDGSSLGYQFMLFIIAIISLTLAIMNVLPIPALDGGRLWLLLGSRAVGRPLSASLEEMVNAVGMVILLFLIALITFVDVHRFF